MCGGGSALLNFDLVSITLACHPSFSLQGPLPPLWVSVLGKTETGMETRDIILHLIPPLREKSSEAAEVMEAILSWYVDLGLKGNNTFHTGKKKKTVERFLPPESSASPHPSNQNKTAGTRAISKRWGYCREVMGGAKNLDVSHFYQC